MGRKLLRALTLGGLAAAAVVVLRRRTAGRRERVDLYFEDGSMVSLGEGTEAGERILPVARSILADTAA